MIQVIAVTTAKPGQREAVLDIFRANAPTVRAQQGCIEYAAYTDLPKGPEMQALLGPETFVVIEKWASMDALMAHATAPHTASYRARTKDLVANRRAHILTPI